MLQVNLFAVICCESYT